MVLYFAYGSNLHPRRLNARIPIVRDLGPTRLEGWALRFHKRGQDGSGKGDIVETGQNRDIVHGALYVLDKDAREQLDAIEGVGAGYRQKTLVLPSFGPAYCYVAETSHIDPQQMPYDWYLALVIHGAKHRQFPDEYIEALSRTPSIPDPDPRRVAAAKTILGN